MKLHTTLLAIILCISYAQAQDGVSVNTTGADPDASAILDVSSTTKGALFPRMTQTQRDAIGTPALGLTIYQTDGVAGYYNWNGSAWVKAGAFEFDGTQAFFLGGSVGIGTSPIAYKLHVDGDARFDASYVSSNFMSINYHATGDREANLNFNASDNLADATIRRNPGANGNLVITNQGTGNLNLGTDDSGSLNLFTSNTNRITINPSGNVGIGATSPGQRLWVADTDTSEVAVNSTSGGAVSAFRSIGGGYGEIGTLGAYDFALMTNDTEVMRVTSGGSVGIGTTIPDQLLSVNGNASKVGGGTWATFSDRRVKKNINAFNSGLSTLQKINPVTFQYNGLAGYEDNGKEYVGIIAQEVQPLAPYMFEKVSKKLKEEDAQKTDLWMYDSNALTYILVNSIKEQQAQIEELKKQLAQKNGEVQSLQSDKKQLEASLQSIDARLKEIESLLKQ